MLRSRPSQAFDDFPLRLHREANAVDVVWRDSRPDSYQFVQAKIGSPNRSSRTPGPSPGPSPRQGQGRGKGITSRSPPQDPTGETVLRRERFIFDHLFIGDDGLGRLLQVAKQRVQRALADDGRGTVFVCLACGDPGPSKGPSSFSSSSSLSSSLTRSRSIGAVQGPDKRHGSWDGLEPTVELLLGDGTAVGGNLLTAVVDHLFEILQSTPGVGSGSPARTKSTKMTRQKGLTARFRSDPAEPAPVQMVISAVEISNCDGEESITDLLGGALSGCEGAVCAVERRGDGCMGLTNATWVRLVSASDIDRVIGVLLARLRLGVDALLMGCGAVSSCLLVSIHVGGAYVALPYDKLVSNAKVNAQFQFVCPLGPRWDEPGT